MRCATEVPPALAVLATAQTGVGVVGALLFPLAVIHRRTSVGRMLRNFGWVLFGHVLGGLLLMALPLYLAYRPSVDED